MNGDSHIRLGRNELEYCGLLIIVLFPHQFYYNRFAGYSMSHKQASSRHSNGAIEQFEVGKLFRGITLRFNVIRGKERKSNKYLSVKRDEVG
jgi:hypothetical protein